MKNQLVFPKHADALFEEAHMELERDRLDAIENLLLRKVFRKQLDKGRLWRTLKASVRDAQARRCTTKTEMNSHPFNAPPPSTR